MATEAAYQTLIASMSHLQVANKALADMISTIAEGIAEIYPFYKHLKKAQTKWEGETIAQWTMDIGMPEAYGFNGYSTLEQQYPEGLLPLTVPKANGYIRMVYARTDLDSNMNEDRLVAYQARAINRARLGAARRMELLLMGDGTTDGNGDTIATTLKWTRPIYGLGYAIRQSPTTLPVTLYGQTNSTTAYHLHNNQIQISSGGVNGVTTTHFDKIHAMCSHDGISPDLYLMGEDMFRRCQTLARTDRWLGANASYDFSSPDSFTYRNAQFMSSKALTSKANGGLIDTEFKGLYALTVGNECMEWRVGPNDWALDPIEKRQDQMAYTQDFVWNGQFICKQFRHQGLIWWS